MSALKEIVDRYERLVLLIGGADIDSWMHIISRARAELAERERGVDVLLLAQHMEDARWGVDLGWVEDMTKALRAQNVRVVEDGKERSDV